jgi:hypothetical protein
MKSAILMASLAAAAVASPAFAGPDRFEMGTGCPMSNVVCAQQDLTNDGGKPESGAVSDHGTIGAISSGLNANATQNTSLGGTGVSPGASSSSGSPGENGAAVAGSLHNP